MMNGKLIAGSLALFLMLFSLCAAPAVYAIEPLELYMESVNTEIAGAMLIYCNTNAEEVPLPSDFSATLGNTKLDVHDVATVAETTGVGTSLVFLVDVSGSIRSAHFQSIKDTIALICGELAENDNISIFTIGDATYTQPFVSDPEDIQAQIDAIERSNEDTNLYESIFTTLAILDTHEECRDKKALIIFSDGEEDIFRGITIDEAAMKIRDSHIPIYTVAMLGKNPQARYVESAKILGSFARLSAGGRHYIHDLDQRVSEWIAADISESIRNGLIVLVGLEGFRSNGSDMVLRLELTIPGVGTASDGYAIPTAGLSAPDRPPPTYAPPESPDATTTPPVLSPQVPTPDTSEPELQADPKPERTYAPEEEKSFLQENLMWIAICGAALVLIIAAALIIVLHRKKNADVPAVPGQATFEPVSAPVAYPPVRPMSAAPPQGRPRIALRLTKIGLSEEQVFRSEFAGELVIGRDPSKTSLSFKDDDLLSGRHCSISYEPDGIALRDLGSTNRTFVNGVPIHERYLLENDDVLLIGSMELRVNWEKI